VLRHGVAHDRWAAWPVTPGITLSLVVAACLYIAGQPRSSSAPDGSAALRHLSFFGGLAALFLALQSPIEPISDHVFIVHQVEHMLLRTVGPMLLMLAAPQAALLRGLPAWMRRGVVTPLLSSRTLRPLGLLGHPAVATVLFVGTTYFWMIPRYHDIAILDEPIHYLWHTTLLLSGLIFFWRIFDPRPSPLGASLGIRLLMFWFASIGNILLGSYLSFKHEVLYHAYDVMGRLWGLSPATDERFGGLTMWIMGGMMFGVTALAVIYRWCRQEERTAARRQADQVEIVRADEFRSRQRSGNRALAFGLLGFAALVCALAVTMAVVYDDGSRHQIITQL
jgi:putative membrane protein